MTPHATANLLAVVSSYVLLGITLGAVAAAIGAGAIVLMAFSLLRPKRMTDGRAAWLLQRVSPEDLGLAYEDLDFSVRDKASGALLKLTGWWMPHPQPSGRCIILLHAYGDAKVGVIAFAPFFREHGFNVLAIDLRAHGQSAGKHVAGGDREANDIRQVIDQLLASHSVLTRTLLLFGIDLGGAVAARLASSADINGLVIDSPIVNYGATARRRMDLIGYPGWPFAPLAIRLAQAIVGANFARDGGVEAAAKIVCPVMLITTDDNRLVSAQERHELIQAIAARPAASAADTTLELPSTEHGSGWHSQPELYRNSLDEFLARIPPKSALSASQVPELPHQTP